jgi:hypothetical protein
MEQECVISGLNLALSRTKTFISPVQILCFLTALKHLICHQLELLDLALNYLEVSESMAKKISSKNVTKKNWLRGRPAASVLRGRRVASLSKRVQNSNQGKNIVFAERYQKMAGSREESWSETRRWTFPFQALI